MSENNTSALALSRAGWALAPAPTEEEKAIQRGITETMRAVVADRYNPSVREGTSKVIPAGASMVRPGGELNIIPSNTPGWVKEIPIKSPMPNGSFIEKVIGGMCDAALGPALPAAKPKGGTGE